MSVVFDDPRQFDLMQRAFYAFFDSDLLTRSDYLHLLTVLSEKLPIYEKGGDIESFKRLAIDYAKYNYPPNPDIDKAVAAFVDGIAGIPVHLVSKSLALILKRTEVSDQFVGAEARENFFLYDTAPSELDLIKKFARR